MSPPKPNIVYIHCHDAGRYIQPYGYAVPTPNLQRLAEEGVLFRNAFCMGPTCSPSRAALLTGQAPHCAGMHGITNANLGGFSLNDYRQHLVHTLRTAGYTSTLCGFQHVAEDPHDIGYDTVMDIDYKANSCNTREVIPHATAFLDARPAEPFFLTVGTAEPHSIMDGSTQAWFTPDPERSDGRYVRPPAILPDHPGIRHHMADYNRAVQTFDDGVGAVLDALERNGLSENTLVIATTDHGIDFPWMKGNLTDHGLGVFLICRGPDGFQGGRVLDGLVSHIDLFPTLCDLLDIPRPDWLQGISLLPMVREGVKNLREEIYGELTCHGVYEPQRCVRTERWKYIRHFDAALPPHHAEGGAWPRTGPFEQPLPNTGPGISRDIMLEYGAGHCLPPTEALHDLFMDPMERVNLADHPDYARILTHMRARLDRWMRETHDPLLSGDNPGTGPNFKR